MLSSQAQERLASITAKYRSALPGKRDELTQLWSTAQSAHWPLEQREVIWAAAHQLAGTCSLYGFTDIAQAASALDQKLAPMRSDAEADPNQLGADYQAVIDAFAATLAD